MNAELKKTAEWLASYYMPKTAIGYSSYVEDILEALTKAELDGFNRGLKYGRKLND